MIFIELRDVFFFAGDLVKVYNELGYTAAVSDIDFHPHDNIVAFCSFGQNHPVILYQSQQTGWWNIHSYSCNIIIHSSFKTILVLASFFDICISQKYNYRYSGRSPIYSYKSSNVPTAYDKPYTGTDYGTLADVRTKDAGTNFNTYGRCRVGNYTAQ